MQVAVMPTLRACCHSMAGATWCMDSEHRVPRRYLRQHGWWVRCLADARDVEGVQVAGGEAVEGVLGHGKLLHVCMGYIGAWEL